jgi:hypothetical protein
VETVEQQPLKTETNSATVLLSTLPQPTTQLLPITQEPASIKAEDFTNSSGSPLKTIQAKLRIDGETKEEIDAITLLLQQTFDVADESEDYRNRGRTGYRRYLTVRVALSS